MSEELQKFLEISLYIIVGVLGFSLREILYNIKAKVKSIGLKTEEMEDEVAMHKANINFLQKQVDEEKIAVRKLEDEVKKKKNL